MNTKKQIGKIKTISVDNAKESEHNISFDFSELTDRSYTQRGAKKDGNFFIDFLGKMKKYSGVQWSVVMGTQKHGTVGSEILDKGEALTEHVSKDVPAEIKKVIIFRCNNDNRALVGYRKNDLFKVLFIEYKFGDICRH